MKKLSILLLSFLAVFTGIQPAAAPKDGVPAKRIQSRLAKESAIENKVLWLGQSGKLSTELWDHILTYADIDDVLRNKLYTKALENPSDTLNARFVAYSPDGKHMAVECEDAQRKPIVKIINVETKQEISFSYYTEGWLSALAYAPDGKTIVTVDRGSIKLWDANTGRGAFRLTEERSAYSVAYSPNGKQLVTGLANNTAKIWEVETGQEIRQLIGHTQAIGAVAYSPDGQYIATGSWDNTVKIWDAETGQEINTLNGHTEAIRSLAFSPDGNYLVSGSWDGTAKIWNSVAGQQIGRLVDVNCFESVAYSPNGKYIVSGSSSGTAKIWDVQTKKEIHTLQVSDNSMSIGNFIGAALGHNFLFNTITVAFSTDGKQIITIPRSGKTKVWDISTLDYKFNSEQIQILRLLDQESKYASKIYLSDIESENPRARKLKLKANFKKIFPQEILDVVIKTYHIQDILPPQNHMGLYVAGAAALAGALAWFKWIKY